MIYNGTKSVTTHGNPVALSATSIHAVWIQIRSKTDNAGNIYFGGPAGTFNGQVNGAVSATNAAYIGAGEAMLFPPCSDINFYDLSTIYIDSDTDGEGVVFTYARR
jgi:hypothetical protein